MKDSIKIFVIAFTIIVILSISLIVSSNNANSTDDINKKISSEIRYLDNILIDMLNKSNGISMENYIVEAEKVQTEQNSKGEEESSSVRLFRRV